MRTLWKGYAGHDLDNITWAMAMRHRDVALALQVTPVQLHGLGCLFHVRQPKLSSRLDFSIGGACLPGETQLACCRSRGISPRVAAGIKKNAMTVRENFGNLARLIIRENFGDLSNLVAAVGSSLI
jgi:hypothetical protein